MWRLHGETIPCTSRYASSLVNIGREFGDLDAGYSGKLPWAVDALACLAALGRELVMELIDARAIDER